MPKPEAKRLAEQAAAKQREEEAAVKRAAVAEAARAKAEAVKEAAKADAVARETARRAGKAATAYTVATVNGVATPELTQEERLDVVKQGLGTRNAHQRVSEIIETNSALGGGNA